MFARLFLTARSLANSKEGISIHVGKILVSCKNSTDCGPLPVPVSAHYKGNQTKDVSTVYNSTLMYVCLPGYVANEKGSTEGTMRCTGDGVWEPEPFCSPEGTLHELFFLSNVLLGDDVLLLTLLF